MRVEPLFRISDVLVCPSCRALFLNQQVADLTEEGPEYLECSRCHQRFPVLHHVPSLVVWDTHSIHNVRELVMYYDFYEKLRNRSFEGDRIEHKLEEFRNSKDIYVKAFQKALQQIDFSGNPLVCDIGAGMCETSKALADRGARVIATDFSPLDILRPRLFSLHNEPINDFYAIFDGVRQWNDNEINFRRVLCDATRLPLKDECVDAVFYRATLHHFRSIPQALREAARILVPHGRLIISCEPSRSILDREKPYLDYLLDYQEGISEHVPVLPTYLFALARAGFGTISLECLFPSYGHRISRLLGVLRRHPDAKRFDGYKAHTLSGILKMLPISCVVNIYARKHRRKRFPPRQEKLTQPFTDRTLADVVLNFDENVADCRRLYRASLSRSGLRDTVDFGKPLDRMNSRGWRNVETIGAEKARFPLRDAFTYMFTSRAHPRLVMRIFGVPRKVARKYSLKVFINDAQVQLPAPIEPGWQQLAFDIDHTAHDGIYEVRLQQANLFRPVDVYGIEDYRELGIGVQWMKLA